MSKKYLALLFLLAGCGGGGTSTPTPFDGMWTGVEEPAGVTPFVQWRIRSGNITGGHITEQDRFVDSCVGKVEKDGTAVLKWKDEKLEGTFTMTPGHLYGEMGSRRYHLLWSPH